MNSIRTKNYLNQIKGSFLYKILGMVLSFITLPIVIGYLGPSKFGVWSTMLTLISWITLFDFGIGNGLKNKITENVSNKNNKDLNEYISTAYILFFFIAFVFFIFIFIISFNLDWNKVFNIEGDILSNRDIRIVFICFSFFILLEFWLGLVKQICQGLQKTSLTVLSKFLANLLIFFAVLSISKISKSSLLYIVLIYGVSLNVANIPLYTLILRNKNLKPKIRFYYKKAKPLLTIGGKFFIIQLAGIVIFMSDKMVITQLIGPQEVTNYQVVYKLYSLIIVLHSLILAPLWPAFSDAFTIKDNNWIKKQIFYQIKFFLLIVVALFILAIIGKWIIKIWIGQYVNIPNDLFLFFSLFIGVCVWNNIFACFLNSINILNIQLITAIIGGVINIPLSIFFIKYLGLNVSGVVIASTISLIIFSICGPIQVFYVLYKSKEV